ncbi:hypothetical protein V8C37DRAFT_411385 [Trichoderma ceciliae]
MNNDCDHLRLTPECGICSCMIRRHERVIANPCLTRVDGFQLCRYQDCSRCFTSPEFAPVHYDCYVMFKENSNIKNPNVLHRTLWIIAAWKKPWLGARPLHLPYRHVDVGGLEIAAEAFGLPELSRLSKLPIELLDSIHDYSEDSLLWRCVSALKSAADASNLDDEPSSIIPLATILSWERYGGIQSAAPKSLPPVMRVTMDADSISKVERLAMHPQYAGECHKHFAYIVTDGDIETEPANSASPKNGRLRLQLTRGQCAPPIWNTPAPFSLSRNGVPGQFSWRRFYVIEMAAVRGITFFFLKGELFGIHAHYSEEESALSTYERFPFRLKPNIIWIYLPVSRGDPITHLALTGNQQSHFRILGPTILGSQIIGMINFTGYSFLKAAPITLSYAEPQEGRSVWLFNKDSNRTCMPNSYAVPVGPSNFGASIYCSHANLEHVSSATIFHRPDDQTCRGILFQYLDGTSQTVGQCRMHFDRTVTVVNPQAFCFRITFQPSTPTHAFFRHHITLKHNAQHHQAGWRCFPMDGSVVFWFTEKTTSLCIGPAFKAEDKGR